MSLCKSDQDEMKLIIKNMQSQINKGRDDIGFRKLTQDEVIFEVLKTVAANKGFYVAGTFLK